MYWGSDLAILCQFCCSVQRICLGECSFPHHIFSFSFKFYLPFCFMNAFGFGLTFSAFGTVYLSLSLSLFLFSLSVFSPLFLSLPCFVELWIFLFSPSPSFVESQCKYAERKEERKNEDNNTQINNTTQNCLLLMLFIKRQQN